MRKKAQNSFTHEGGTDIFKLKELEQHQDSCHTAAPRHYRGADQMQSFAVYAQTQHTSGNGDSRLSLWHGLCLAGAAQPVERRFGWVGMPGFLPYGANRSALTPLCAAGARLT
jgi:hypothetical protein